MRRISALVLAALVVAAVVAGSASASGSSVVRVTNANNAGTGSFRAAIEKANMDASVGKIEFRFGLPPIKLLQPVVYDGDQSLDIVGAGAVLDGVLLPSTSEALFSTTNTPGNLSVSLLTIRNAPQHGLAYEVPTNANGTNKVALLGVKIVGNGGHGVVINDQEDPDDAPDPDVPTHGNSNGSDASLDVTVVGSRFAENGAALTSPSDRDGLRINEGGLGSLNVVISLSQFEDNGADGLELDERGDGDVRFNISASQFTGNGEQDPTDLDDGMDVDEVDAGALIGKVLASSASDNFEEGWDFNENDLGDFRVDMTLVEASRNGEEGFDFEEDDDFAGGGDLTTTLIAVKANGNGTTNAGDAGLKIREKGLGNLDATVKSAEANGNKADGIQIREDADGNLLAIVDRSTTNNNTAGDDGDGNGVNFDENGNGELNATLSRSNSGGNVAAGVRADEGGGGGATSSLTLLMTTFNPANAGGDIDSSVPVV